MDEFSVEGDVEEPAPAQDTGADGECSRLKGFIDDIPPDQQAAVKEATNIIRRYWRKGGENILEVGKQRLEAGEHLSVKQVVAIIDACKNCLQPVDADPTTVASVS